MEQCVNFTSEPQSDGLTRNRALESKKAMHLALDNTVSVLQKWQDELVEREHELEQDRMNFDAEMALRKSELEQSYTAKFAELEDKTSRLEDEKNRMLGDQLSGADIISINMGGEKTVQVKRSLLTQFEGSFLASMFSGRWEQQLVRDANGDVFFDEPPQVMMPLIDWLRDCRDATPDHPAVVPDVETKYQRSWYRMMDRLGLPVIPEQPPKWKKYVDPGFSWEANPIMSNGYRTLIADSIHAMPLCSGLYMLQFSIQTHRMYHDVGCVGHRFTTHLLSNECGRRPRTRINTDGEYEVVFDTNRCVLMVYRAPAREQVDSCNFGDLEPPLRPAISLYGADASVRVLSFSHYSGL